MTEYEKRWVENVEYKFEKDMLRTCNKYLRMLYNLRAKEDWITLNEVDGEFAEERTQHVSKYKADMTAIRFSFIRRSIAYTETCNIETSSFFIGDGWSVK